MTDQLIIEFWQWFESTAQLIDQELSQQEDNDQLTPGLAELDRRVKLFDGNFSWEIGPFLDNTTFLAISPAGDRNKLETTRRITNAAPNIRGWKFLAAKPPKNENRRNFIFGDQHITTTDWRYTLVRWQNPTEYGVTWIPPADLELPNSSLSAIAWFLLECELGEEAATELFDFSEISYDSDVDATAIEHFRDHFAQLNSDAR